MARKESRPEERESTVHDAAEETQAPVRLSDDDSPEGGERQPVSRRTLLQAAGGLSLAGLVAKYSPTQLDAQARRRAAARQWDMEADVVVLGYGAAGGAAA